MTVDQENQDIFPQQLKRLLAAIEASGRAILPRDNDELLKSIVEAAARIFNAAAASILLVNEAERCLEFKVSHGAADHSLAGMKFPLDKGIAGYVIMTGQPITISNVRQDARFNQDFAKSTGYVPNSILAIPLQAGGRIIGVMEVLDKVNAPAFGVQDMELLGMFARQAALAINQSQQMMRIEEALIEGLKKLSMAGSAGETDQVRSVLEESGREAAGGDLLALAGLFNEISSLGEAEQKACLQVLETFAAYSRSKRRTWK